MTMYKLACQDSFPLHAICRSAWKNSEGKLSFLKYAVSAPPELFTFSHSVRLLPYADVLHGLKFQPGESNYAWLCLDLLDVICQLAERGHAAAIRSMLDYPLKHCPKVLLLGIAEIQILHDVLDKIPFSFAIRLPALASQKELLDLEKWLSISLVTDDGSFLEESLGFLKEIGCLTSSEVNANRLSQMCAVGDLHSWTAYINVKVLQANAWRVDSRTLSNEIEKLHISSMHGNSYQRSDEVHGASLSDAHSVEAEANSYFKCIFSEQLTVDEMVQMLAHLKESSEEREHSIFKCIIFNLLKEYRLFPNYPERQLGLAAVLFGSVIQCQLVTHLALGMSLRCVLDALRKAENSKMFAYGTKALEQFVNRLYEWPQYCNHILQISHMHGSHPELVACIEEVLAKRSHCENGPVDQLNVSSATVNENPKYNFWNHSFTRCAPEIQNLLENAWRKLGCPKPVNEANVVSDDHLTIHA